MPNRRTSKNIAHRAWRKNQRLIQAVVHDLIMNSDDYRAALEFLQQLAFEDIAEEMSAALKLPRKYVMGERDGD